MGLALLFSKAEAPPGHREVLGSTSRPGSLLYQLGWVDNARGRKGSVHSLAWREVWEVCLETHKCTETEAILQQGGTHKRAPGCEK